MGNIGDPITETIPAVGTSGTTYATDINLFLTEVKDRLEALVPRSSLEAGTLNMEGEAIENALYVEMDDGTGETIPTASLFQIGSDLYWQNSGGDVQITDGTSLNTALLGGITGDYGGANPAQFRFVDADQEYYAYDDYGTGAWARVWARNFDIAAGASSAVRARLAFGGGSSVTYTLPTAVPSSSNVLMQMDTAGQITVSNTVGQDVTLSANKSVVVSGTGDYKHGEWTEIAPFGFTTHTQTGALSKNFSAGIIKWVLDASGLTYHFFPKLRVGWRLKQVVVRGLSASAASLTPIIQNATVLPTLNISNSGNFTGGTATATFVTPYTVALHDMLQVAVSAGSNTVDLYDVAVTYDVV